MSSPCLKRHTCLYLLRTQMKHVHVCLNKNQHKVRKQKFQAFRSQKKWANKMKKKKKTRQFACFTLTHAHTHTHHTGSLTQTLEHIDRENLFEGCRLSPIDDLVNVTIPSFKPNNYIRRSNKENWKFMWCAVDIITWSTCILSMLQWILMHSRIGTLY